MFSSAPKKKKLAAEQQLAVGESAAGRATTPTIIKILVVPSPLIENSFDDKYWPFVRWLGPQVSPLLTPVFVVAAAAPTSAYPEIGQEPVEE